jgi:hypothetical protein
MILNHNKKLFIKDNQAAIEHNYNVCHRGSYDPHDYIWDCKIDKVYQTDGDHLIEVKLHAI